MRERFGAKNARSWMLRFHTQTAGCSLTAQQPLNNIARVTVQALAAVLGGTQSLHTDSFDEALALPTEQAVTVALRTQQILAEESGVTHTIDPLGGSYFVEALTDRVERDALAYIERIDQMGGMIGAIERGFPQKEIADASYHYQRQTDRGVKTIVGVNKFANPNEARMDILKIGEGVENAQLARLAEVKRRRDAAALAAGLAALRAAAENGANVIPPMLDCVRNYGTVQEISQALVPVFGTYQEVSVL
jgi:methylmalonyl-CoA mutase N-terminal domain/subunit